MGRLNLTAAALTLTTLSFLVALSWNNTARALYNKIVGGRDTVTTRVVFSFILTALAIWIFEYFSLKSRDHLAIEKAKQRDRLIEELRKLNENSTTQMQVPGSGSQNSDSRVVVPPTTMPAIGRASGSALEGYLQSYLL